MSKEMIFGFIEHTFWSGALQHFNGLQVILLLLVAASIIGIVRFVILMAIHS